LIITTRVEKQCTWTLKCIIFITKSQKIAERSTPLADEGFVSRPPFIFVDQKLCKVEHFWLFLTLDMYFLAQKYFYFDPPTPSPKTFPCQWSFNCLNLRIKIGKDYSHNVIKMSSSKQHY